MLEIKKTRKKDTSRPFANTSLTLQLARADEKAKLDDERQEDMNFLNKLWKIVKKVKRVDFHLADFDMLMRKMNEKLLKNRAEMMELISEKTSLEEEKELKATTERKLFKNTPID